MPDRQYIKFPRPESIRYFENAMNRHNRVLSCIRISKGYYEIKRDELPPIHVFVSNYYALSISDYYEITESIVLIVLLRYQIGTK